MDQLEGNNNKDQIYELMTNENKLRSVIEKKHVSKKSQKHRDKNLCKNKTEISLCDRDKRLSYGLASQHAQNFENNEITQSYDQNSSRVSKLDNNGDWKIQTYNKFGNIDQKFEPILENSKDETYGTISHKRIKNKKKSDFREFYNREMNFVEAKYNHIANQQAAREHQDAVKYDDLKRKNVLMSSRSKKILQNRYKEGMIKKNSKNKSIKISKLFDTPVHERLFIDNEIRK